MDGSRAILVVGMHRSGTSAVAGALHALGVHFGTPLLGPAPENPRGFFEHERLLALHNRLLAAFGSTWSDPRPLPRGWLHDRRTSAVRGAIREVVEGDLQRAPVFGVKDPRLCRLAPLWGAVLEDLGVPFKVVFVARPPVEVARSLQARNGFPMARGLSLWRAGVLDAERGTRAADRTPVLYPDLLADPAGELGRLGEALAISTGGASGARARGFLSPSLRHHSADHGTSGAPAAGLAGPDGMWRALVAWRRTGEDPASAFDAVRSRG